MKTESKARAQADEQEEHEPGWILGKEIPQAFILSFAYRALFVLLILSKRNTTNPGT